MNQLRLSAKLYLATLVVGTPGLTSVTLARASLPDPERVVLAGLFAGLMTIAMLFPLPFTSGTKLSFHTSVIFATTLLFEPGIAMLIVGMGTLLAQFIRRQPWGQTLFTSAQSMLQAGVGGLILAGFGWNFDDPMFNRPELAPVIVAAAGVICLIEFLSMATIVGLVSQSRQSLLPMWRQLASFDWVELLAQFALGLLAVMIAATHFWVLPLLVPLALVIYRLSERHIQLCQQIQALTHQAFHDPLTALPNRALFLDRLEHAIARAARHQQAIAILFLDLDDFKVINDSLGHAAGDRVLIAVAERLQACLRPEDTVARLGGEEFTVLLEDITQVCDTTRVAERITQVLQAPLILAGQEVFITASIGIALSGAGCGQPNPQQLLRDADAAMYQAKAKGKACYEVFAMKMNARATEHLKLETVGDVAI